MPNPVRHDARPVQLPPDQRWQFLGIGLLIVAYVVVFLVVHPKRQFVLSLLMLPDQLVLSWVDHDWGRFAILDRVPILLAVGGILLGAYVMGRLLLEWTHADERLSRLECTLFALGAGLNLVSLYVLAIGLVGGLQQSLAFILPGLAWIIFGATRWRVWCHPAPASGDADPPAEPRWLTRTFQGCSLVFALVIIAGAILPPWHFDTREYHLQVPKEWYQQGAVTFLPHNVYGNMPLGAELHAVIGMNLMTGPGNWWWGALVGKTIIGVYAPLTAFLLWACGRRLNSPLAGAIAAVVFISTPWVTHVSTSGLIDGASAFYAFATLYAFMVWRHREETDRAAQGHLLLTGFMAGAAVACKYPAVLFVVLPALGAIACWPLGKVHLRAAVIYSVAVAAACGLWFGKNLVLTHNPTYPLLYRLFDGTTRTPEKDAQWTRAHGPPRDAVGRSFHWAQLRDSATLLLWGSEFHSPLLVPLAALALLNRRQRTVCGILLGLLCFNFVAWFLLTHRIDRFLVPTLPLVALLAGIGATWSTSRIWWRGLGTFMILGLAFNLAFVSSPIPGDNRFITSLESLRRDTPTDGPFSAERIHNAHKYLNTHVQPGFQVMAVGEAQVFDFEVPVIYNTCFDDCVFEQMLKGRTSDERLAELRRQRISHIFVFWYHLDRYRSPGNYGYSDYVTRELIRDEFVETGLLREIPLDVAPGNSQLFEVIGWETWPSP